MLDESTPETLEESAPASPVGVWLRTGTRRRVPLFRQAEAAECGLACLAMVAAHLGHATDLATVRRECRVSLRGMSLMQLVDAARQLNLSVRPLRVELGSLRELRAPAILHWNFEHFVVLVEADARRVVINDPACGRRELDYAEVSRCFTGVALELERGVGFAPRPAPPALRLRDLTGTVTGLKRSLAQLLALSLALQALLLVAPFFVQLVMDQVLVSAQADFLTVLGLGFGALLLAQVGMAALRGWSVATLSEQLGVQWKSYVLAHLLRLPVEFFEKRNLGDVNSRVGSINQIRTTLSAQFVEALIDGLMAIAVFAILLVYDARLALLPLAAVLLYALLRALAYAPVRATTEQQLERDARQQSHLLESLRGMRTLKSSGLEGLRLAGWQNLLVATANADLRQARLQTLFQSLSQAIFGLERIAVVWIGALLVLDGHMSAGMLVAFIAYKDLFAQRLGALIDKAVQFRMLRVHGERLADLLLTPPEADAPERVDAPESTSVAGPPAKRGLFEGEDLGFRYGDGERWILRHCDLRIAAGESVAIVGPSGCGKSTLLKLLIGLLPPVEGQVLLGGRDIRVLGLRRFRAQLGAVLQDDHLFAGSLLENIAGFDPQAREEDVERVARQAQMHEEIVAMPMGYRSLIGDMGSALSGGQKQRLLLARALYRKPRILLLDEATSHLDLDNERAVNASIRELDITRIVIAHRRETIAAADRVLAFENGRLVPR